MILPMERIERERGGETWKEVITRTKARDVESGSETAFRRTEDNNMILQMEEEGEAWMDKEVITRTTSIGINHQASKNNGMRTVYLKPSHF